MKKIILAVMLLLGVVASKAQFEAGTTYVGASVSNLGMSYSSNEKLRFGIDATMGYFLWEDVMLKASVGYNHKPHLDDITLGLGGRYYFDQNGIFLGTGVEYCHEAPKYNDLRIPAEIGYCFYLNHYLSIEPVAYYNFSINDYHDKSSFGFKVGLGFYF